jgi:magnesium chelatase family protein
VHQSGFDKYNNTLLLSLRNSLPRARGHHVRANIDACRIDARPVEVQVRITPGAAAFAIVGLPDKAVAESRERVRNALHAIGLGLPFKHITVNLAPADLPKEGSHFDLPIVLAMMTAMEAIAPDAILPYAAIGELALDGSIRAVPGALPAAIGANTMGKGLICPQATGSEAAWASEEIDILAAPHLLSLVNHFKGMQTLSRPKPNVVPTERYLADLCSIASICKSRFRQSRPPISSCRKPLKAVPRFGHA